jgi:hypothetical protein
MVELIADDRCLLKDLGRFIEPVEVLDANGNLLGLFVPANLERGKQIYAESMARIDWAEIDRRATEEAGKGVPLRVVFEHLMTLTTDPAVLADLQRHIDEMRAREGCPTR